MPGIASVHFADIGARAAIAFVCRAPRAAGLLHADVGLAAPLGGSALPRPQLDRVGMVAFWEDVEAAEQFLAGHPAAARLAGGWHATLEPLRAHGAWPGLSESVPAARATEYDAPSVVVTLGRFRVRRAVPFFRASNRAERSLAGAKGLVWATGLARPPFVATCSLWESTRALTTYAYGHQDPGHPDAIKEGDDKPFHVRSAFIRFRALSTAGTLDGKNPMPKQRVHE
jgi:hypothetical protein